MYHCICNYGSEERTSRPTGTAVIIVKNCFIYTLQRQLIFELRIFVISHIQLQNLSKENFLEYIHMYLVFPTV